MPLLRWAVSGERRDVFAALGIGLGTMVCCVTAFGQVGKPFGFGLSVLVYALGAVNLIALCRSLWVRIGWLKVGVFFLALLLWCWVLLGMPMNAALIYKALPAGAVLLLSGVGFGFKCETEQGRLGHGRDAFFLLLVVCASLFVFAQIVGDRMAGYFALALATVCAGGLFWSHPRLKTELAQNGLLPVSLSVAALSWDLWLQGHLPLISLLCLVMVVFTGHSTEKMFLAKSVWMGKIRLLFVGGLSLLPVLLAFVFFDVLRNF